MNLHSESQLGYFQQTQSSQGIKNIGGSGVIADLSSAQNERWGLGLRTLAHGADDTKASLYRLGFGGFAFFRLLPNISTKIGSLYYQESNEKHHHLGGDAGLKSQGQGFAIFFDLYHYISLYTGVDLGFGSTLLWARGSYKTEFLENQTLRQNQQSLIQGISVALKVLL